MTAYEMHENQHDVTFNKCEDIFSDLIFTLMFLVHKASQNSLYLASYSYVCLSMQLYS